MITGEETIVIMISVGNRTRLTNYTFSPLSLWAASHNYSCILIKKNLTEIGVAPHFNKLIAHKLVPGYKRYVIVDDDLMIKPYAPAIPAIPDGFVGLSKDAVQQNTQIQHVNWTGNTGFIVADSNALPLLEEAYANGEYPYNCWDGSNKGIWGPHDQAALLNVLFLKKRAYELAPEWNYQPVIDFYVSGKGWDNWKNNRGYRLWYYLSLFLPFTKSHKKLKTAHGLHMTMGLYPRFFKLFV